MPAIAARRSALAATILGSLLLPCLASAQGLGGPRLLVHLPLDGSTSASVGGQTVLLGPQPQAVAGKVGQAMKFGGNSVIAVPVDISPSGHGKITVTAWVRVDQAAPDAGGHTIVSGGGNAAPALRVVKRRSDGFKTRFKGGRAELHATSFSPNEEWVFVSGAVDLPSESLRVLQGDSANERSGIRTDSLYDAPEYENPDDPDAEQRAWVFIGANNFNLQWPARSVAIDEARVYAGALDASQLRSVRDGGSAHVAAVDVPGGSGGDINIGDRESPTAEIERKRRDGESGDDDITIANRESPTAEIERKRREGGENESEPADQQPEPESEAEPETEPEPATGVGWHLSTSDVRRTGITGTQGDIVIPMDFADSGWSLLEIGENFDIPCFVRIAAEGDNYINGTRAWRRLSIDRCGSGYTPFALFTTRDIDVDITPALVSGISLCPRSSNNPRVKGVEIRGDVLNADGTLGLYRQDTGKKTNCDESAWTTLKVCAPGYKASGIVAHFSDRGNNDELVGMQLICRKVIQINN